MRADMRKQRQPRFQMLCSIKLQNLGDPEDQKILIRRNAFDKVISCSSSITGVIDHTTYGRSPVGGQRTHRLESDAIDGNFEQLGNNCVIASASGPKDSRPFPDKVTAITRQIMGGKPP